ncbi:hypothetical protein [Glaciibacter superstes]|uniref:hypothetical protein n=1 Tax=Glaciibacter superstes TaxID=501023 RepID=UPI0003B43F68|nr:hypothetical protein [Glaciibacter superstes]
MKPLLPSSATQRPVLVFGRRLFGRRLRLVLALVALAVAGLAVLSLGGTPPVEAAVAGRHAGHTWAGDGQSYLGSYRLDDGTVAYCIDQPSGPPMGINYSAPDFAAAIADADTQARLAYLMRQWGASDDPTIAASVALNVWRLTGLGGNTDRYYAARANESTEAVMATADAQLAEAGSQGSRQVSASVAVAVSPDGTTGTVQADLTIDGLAGPYTVPPGTHAASVTLEGAVFTETGSATAQIPNGSVAAITPDTRSLVTVAATAHFDSLPYGGSIGVLYPDDSSRQRLIVASPGTAEATSERVQTPPVVRTLPFQPVVQTQTGATTAEAGQLIDDILTVGATASADNPEGDWGMRGDPAAPEPVALLVRSTLWGPFVDPIVELPAVPDGAVAVCEVSTMVAGPGEYHTDYCQLPAAGYFVWTESIDPSESPHEEGRSQAGAWQSAFGTATEVTLSPWHPAVTTTASSPTAVVGDCLHDAITVVGSQPGYELVITASLWGPFAEAPEPGTQIDEASAPLVGSVDVLFAGDGTLASGCLPTSEPGSYVWTYASPGNAATGEFGSMVVHAEETTLVEMPVVPEQPEVPAAPASPEVSPPHLAETGVNGATMSGLGLLGSASIVIGAGAAGLSLARRGRGRHRS